jgi:hypothetical protein
MNPVLPPACIGDGCDDTRSNRAVGLLSNKYAISDSEAYYTVTNVTPGTGLTWVINSSFSNTVALFTAGYHVPFDAKKRLYVDYLKLIVRTIPGGTPTALHLAARVEPNMSRIPATRASWTGVAIYSVNRDTVLNTWSPLEVHWCSGGTLAAEAETASIRFAGRATIPIRAPVVGDEYLVSFGAVNPCRSASGGLTAAGATAVSRKATNMPPIMLGPQQLLIMHAWIAGASTTAPVFEFEMGLVEK